MLQFEKWLDKYFSVRQKQWVWVIILWLFGLGSVLILSAIIRFAIGVE